MHLGMQKQILTNEHYQNWVVYMEGSINLQQRKGNHKIWINKNINYLFFFLFGEDNCLNLVSNFLLI